jgi:hypothetical protein
MMHFNITFMIFHPLYNVNGIKLLIPFEVLLLYNYFRVILHD